MKLKENLFYHCRNKFLFSLQKIY